MQYNLEASLRTRDYNICVHYSKVQKAALNKAIGVSLTHTDYLMIT